MKRVSSIGVGLTILGIVFAFSLYRQLDRGLQAVAPDSKTIRFAHVQLEGGLREAYDELIREYEALHPEIEVEQIPVPRRVWRFWMESRLAGGMAPDLMQLINNDPNPIGEHFHPIDEWVFEPNPYNAGTELEGVPWIQTLIINSEKPPAFWPQFQAYHAIPLTVFTHRLYYNREKLEAITGYRAIPDDFTAFLEICEAIREHAESTGEPVFPLAGSRMNAPFILDALYESQTQRLKLEALDLRGDLGKDALGAARIGYLRGIWNLRQPEILSALELVSTVGRYFQPGFLFANREDALFQFLQERSVMIVSGSYEFRGISDQATFEIGVTDVPMPVPGQGPYGRHTLGQVNERGLHPRGSFALTRQSSNKEAAIDFLQFLTSREAHQRFVNLSGWVPVVKGVDSPTEARPFYPRMKGAIGGFPFGIGVETVRLWDVSASLLFQDKGVEQFLASVEPVYAGHIIGDIEKEIRNSLDVAANFDWQVAAERLALPGSPEMSETALSRLLLNQIQSERGFYRARQAIRTFQESGIPASETSATGEEGRE